MFIPYFMTALVFCGLIILINWSPFSQVAHLKVFSQQGFKGAVFPIFRGMLLFVSAFFFTLACVANVSSQVRQENWSKSENWDKRGLEKGRKGTLARNSTILKMLSPTNGASDWCGVVVLVEKWNVSSSLSPLPSPLLPCFWLSLQLSPNTSIGSPCYAGYLYLYELLYYIAISFLHFLILFFVLLW